MFRQDFESYYGGIWHTKYGQTTEKARFSNISRNRIPNLTGVIYYFDGCDIIRTGNKTLKTHKDTVRIFPPVSPSDPDVMCRTVEGGSYISTAFISRNPFFTEHAVIDVSSKPVIKNLFFKLNKIWNEKYDNYAIHATSIFFRILEELSELVSSEQKNEPSRLDGAVRYIHKHYSEYDFSYEALPGLCELKRSRFIDLFSQKFGMTPSKYVTSLRMKKAAELLSEKTVSINEIAVQTGYDNPSYFGRVFKRYYGVAPTEYMPDIESIIG